MEISHQAPFENGESDSNNKKRMSDERAETNRFL
jgi:hypothetical protein